MASKQRAKRASRANPRTERSNNVYKFSDFKKQHKQVQLIPKNKSQEEFLDHLEDSSARVVFAVGPAGTGKTMFATLAASRELQNSNIDKIIITRPNVAVDDKDIGYLPGEIDNKMAPWMKPIFDYLKEVFTVEQLTDMFAREIIELCPIAFMRGRTFKNAWVIVDEAQGTKSKDTMKAILTRLGNNSKMIVTGDLAQSDFCGSNGLEDFINRYDRAETKPDSVRVVKFKHKDIERDTTVREVLSLYGEK